MNGPTIEEIIGVSAAQSGTAPGWLIVALVLSGIALIIAAGAKALWSDGGAWASIGVVGVLAMIVGFSLPTSADPVEEKSYHEIVASLEKAYNVNIDAGKHVASDPGDRTSAVVLFEDNSTATCAITVDQVRYTLTCMIDGQPTIIRTDS